MSRRKFSREFKVSAVTLVNEQAYTIAQAARNLGVDPASGSAVVEKLSDEPGMKPRGDGALAAEVQRLRKENARLLIAAGNFKKSGGVLRQGAAVKFAFIQEHLGAFRVETVCQVLEVTRSGYYAWLGRSDSHGHASTGAGGEDQGRPQEQPRGVWEPRICRALKRPRGKRLRKHGGQRDA